jgi:hypothetical protein
MLMTVVRSSLSRIGNSRLPLVRKRVHLCARVSYSPLTPVVRSDRHVQDETGGEATTAATPSEVCARVAPEMQLQFLYREAECTRSAAWQQHQRVSSLPSNVLLPFAPACRL